MRWKPPEKRSATFCRPEGRRRGLPFCESDLGVLLSLAQGRCRSKRRSFRQRDRIQETRARNRREVEKSAERGGGIGKLFGKAIPLPDDKDVELDDDVALDWLVNVNDEIFERIDVSLDEFKRSRNKEEESGVRMMKVDDDDEENGFQMVYGKKNKKMPVGLDRNEEGGGKGVQEVKVAAKVRPKVPFHIPTIPRPQDEFKIIVNNSNQPFEHVWLQRSEDGSRFMHPLEKLSVLDFVDRPDSAVEPVKPLPIEVTPFKLVEDLKGLKFESRTVWK
ncbi:UNVERIFIED_CONTAM: protein RRP6-like 2 [Sesamum calycinum]|uniref:Protein RRP6-like 2 n=1 Tax=Sesamum calycinum TaxID=2727403 RepID=A0AAW2NI47_9LAMI